MLAKRIVITGAGLVTPLGCGLENVWEKIRRGDHGISKMVDVVPEFASISNSAGVHVAAFVPRGEEPGFYNEKQVFGRSVSKEMAGFTQFAIHATDLALENAQLLSAIKNKEISPSSIGLSIGSGGIGSITDMAEGLSTIQASYRKLSPYFVPKILINMAAGQVSIRHGIQGPVHSVATACAAGSHSIGDAFNFLQLGYAEIMIAGGAESSIDPLSIAGFARMRALSTKTDPAMSSSPFDASRDGFVMGEGAGIVVLETLEHALKRNAPIIAEVCGYSLSGDAHHATSPAPVGDGGAQRAMSNVLTRCNLSPNDIDYINCHATSTPVGDNIEVQAIEAVFGSSPRSSDRPLLVSSTKGATGHLLGAAGAVESIFTVLALRDNTVPPTRNLVKPEPDSKLVSYASTENAKTLTSNRVLKYALKNSFGFGGTNAVLCFKKYE